MRQRETTNPSETDGAPVEDRASGHSQPHRGSDPVAFDQRETRTAAMRATIESWLGDLAELVDEASTSRVFQEWLNVQSRFHDYSYRNTFLIMRQRPTATRVAGYRTWLNEFDRQVNEGEQAIWIWAPIVARQCPSCGNTKRHHEASGCDYDQVPSDAWSKGVVAFKPVPVFDVDQTAGPPLPELDTSASGDGVALLERLLAVAGSLDVDVRLLPDDEWRHGTAMGVCVPPRSPTSPPQIEVRQCGDEAAMAGTLLHEYAHAQLHIDGDDPDERSKREVEAEAVAYIVGRCFGLDPSNSAFYLAAWAGEEAGDIGARLDRISRTAEELIETICAS